MTVSKGNIYKSYPCPICNKVVFLSLFSLSRHKNWCYKSSKNPRRDRGSVKSAGNDNNNSKICDYII